MVFKNLLDAATSETLLEDNLQLNLEVVDAIRAHELPHKDAFTAIRLRLKSKNPNVVLRTLSLLEMVVKNCGAQIQCLVAQKEFMDEMRYVINSESAPVRKKALELMQMWGHAFKDEPNYKIVPDTLTSLRAAGFEFPPFNANTSSMFVAEKAPDWVEGENCFKCQSAFNWPFPMFNRKHHCRNCGQIFCQKCSSKTAMLPRFAIETEVRVCDTCYDRLKAGVAGPAPATAPADGPTDLVALQRRLLTGEATEEELMRALARDAAPAPQPRNPEQESRLKEEEELQLAMALSMSEAQAPKAAAATARREQPAPRPAPEPIYPAMPQAPADDPVARYPTLRKQTSNSSTTSVSSKLSLAQAGPGSSSAGANGSPQDDPLSSFLGTLRLLEQRMDSATQAGRHLSTDPAAQTLYRSLLTLHRDVLAQLDVATRREAKYIAVQAKQLDIDAARAQADAEAKAYAERLQQQQREQELLAKMQLEQKMKLLEAQQREQREYQRAMDQSRLGTVAAPAAPYYPSRGPYDASPAPYAPPMSAPAYGAAPYSHAPAPAPGPASPAPLPYAAPSVPAAGPTGPAPQYGGLGDSAYAPAPQYAGHPMAPAAPAYRPAAPGPVSAPSPLSASVYTPLPTPAPAPAPAPVHAPPYGAPGAVPPSYGQAPAPAPAPVHAPVAAQGPGFAPAYQPGAAPAYNHAPFMHQPAPASPQAPAPALTHAVAAPPAYPPVYGATPAAPAGPAVSELISFD